MAGESKIAVTEGSGKNVHTWQRSISAQNVEDDVAIVGEYPYPTYSMVFNGLVTTAADHLVQIMAGAALNVRVKQVRLHQRVVGTASTVELQVLRLTTAGTGGTAVTASKYDNGDAAAGATGINLPGVKGTEGVELMRLYVPTTTAEPKAPYDTVWAPPLGMKPWIIPAGAANGLCFKVVTGVATVTITTVIEFVETSFL